MVALLNGAEREQCAPRSARRIGRAGYRSWLLVVLVVVAVSHKLGQLLGHDLAVSIGDDDAAGMSSRHDLAGWEPP
jgi:hypothetical protein